MMIRKIISITKTIILIQIILIIILLLSNCRTKEREELLFTVDSLLLGNVYENDTIGFSFQPPRNWLPISSDLFSQFQQKLFNFSDSTQFGIEPFAIFMNADITSFCYVCNFISPAKSDKYLAEIKSKLQQRNITEGSFRYNDFQIKQLIIFDEKNVILKLLITDQHNKIFLIDYFVPMKFYEENLRAIESSIGSLKKIN